MISLTDAAYRKIQQTLTRRGHGEGIRLGVRTTGCSGLAYVLEFVDEYTAEEGIINYAQKDFIVLVDAKSQVYLNGVTVDYVRQGLNEGFKFRNPNERDRCGCGESFRI
jgi:iron-sulfur cluster assembly protein